MSDTIDPWGKEKRATLHVTLDGMLDRADRVLLISLGHEGDSTVIIRESKVTTFSRTTNVEMLGAIERVKASLIREMEDE